MKKNTLLLAVLLALILSACAARIVRGSGNVIREFREVSGFDRVDMCCGMELFLTQGNDARLEIEADDNILEEIESIVIADTLRIEFQDQYPDTAYRPTRPIRVFLTISEINYIEISGGGELFASEISTQQLELKLSGGSSAEIKEVDIDEFDLDISGGGDSYVAGQVDEQRVDLSGGSSYEADNLESKDTVIDVSGGGDALIWVTDSLDVNASGGSSVSYYGKPHLTSNTSGGGSLNSLGNR